MRGEMRHNVSPPSTFPLEIDKEEKKCNREEERETKRGIENTLMTYYSCGVRCVYSFKFDL